MKAVEQRGFLGKLKEATQIVLSQAKAAYENADVANEEKRGNSMLKKKKCISVTIIAIMCLCLSGCGIMDSIFGKAYEEVVKKYINAYSDLEEDDVIDILKLLPPEYKDYVLETAEEQIGALDETEFAEYVEKKGESLQIILDTEEDAKFSYEIEDEEELVTVELREFSEELESAGIEIGTPDAGVKAEVNVYEKGDDSNNIEMEILLLKIDGKWYLWNTDAFVCEGFSI